MSQFVKCLALASILAGALAGGTASLDGAQAMPLAPLKSQPAASADTTAVQFDPYGYRGYQRPYRRFYGDRRYRGPAGVYRCGPYRLHTHLSRKACR